MKYEQMIWGCDISPWYTVNGKEPYLLFPVTFIVDIIFRDLECPQPDAL